MTNRVTKTGKNKKRCNNYSTFLFIKRAFILLLVFQQLLFTAALGITSVIVLMAKYPSDTLM